MDFNASSVSLRLMNLMILKHEIEAMVVGNHSNFRTRMVTLGHATTFSMLMLLVDNTYKIRSQTDSKEFLQSRKIIECSAL